MVLSYTGEGCHRFSLGSDVRSERCYRVLQEMNMQSYCTQGTVTSHLIPGDQVKSITFNILGLHFLLDFFNTKKSTDLGAVSVTIHCILFLGCIL